MPTVIYVLFYKDGWPSVEAWQRHIFITDHESATACSFLSSSSLFV